MAYLKKEELNRMYNIKIKNEQNEKKLTFGHLENKEAPINWDQRRRVPMTQKLFWHTQRLRRDCCLTSVISP